MQSGPRPERWGLGSQARQCRFNAESPVSRPPRPRPSGGNCVPVRPLSGAGYRRAVRGRGRRCVPDNRTPPDTWARVWIRGPAGAEADSASVLGKLARVRARSQSNSPIAGPGTVPKPDSCRALGRLAGKLATVPGRTVPCIPRRRLIAAPPQTPTPSPSPRPAIPATCCPIAPALPGRPHRRDGTRAPPPGSTGG